MREGTTVGGRYRLIRCLVNGRATEVWLGRDVQLNRAVVLKRMLVDTAGFSRLEAEARALAAFNHPNVVTLYDAVHDPDDDTYWLVMEHVPGGSLDGRPPMSPEQAAHVGAQIAGALAALHAKRIVHVDVKPGNIIDTGSGVFKLADFGAAYRVGGRETITPNGAIGYTVDYAGPEVVLGRPEPRSDVFSLGATVYALVAGRPPRPGTDEGGSGGHLTGWEAARGAVALTADVGPLEGLLREMLQRDSRDRPNAVEAGQRLAAIARGRAVRPSPARPVSPPRPSGVEGASDPAGNEAARAPVSLLRRPLPLIVAGAALVALAVALRFTLPALSGEAVGRRPSATPLAVPPTTSSPAVSPSPVTATSASSPIGDPRTADPCALTNPAALGRFGRTELDIDYGNFDRCDVIVFPPGGGVVDVKVWLDHDEPSEQAEPAGTVGGIQVIENPAESDRCRRTLILPGVTDTLVKVDADWEDQGQADLCAIADAAATTAAEALDRGPIKRRSPPLPARSLAQRDACSLLRGDALEVVPGIDATDPDVGFGNWECGWDSTTSDTWVDFRFDRDQPPNAADGTATRLNGYRAFVEPEGEGARTCLLQVVYRTYADQHGRPAVEKLHIVVGGSRPVDRLCGMATSLARSATARLRDA
ncbi:serine/threonine-protein kinase [Nonomuraea sp. SYSU D8015]|uniref:serine/threonine-protein kinase n=1 Tax=Nonomuraea sp. SYSU D8015 TaxID=2593644 RepID=UPI001CB747D4|nr:serine/threonine-protein kinase [Nonomuraea sp. SYSU D8015]